LRKPKKVRTKSIDAGIRAAMAKNGRHESEWRLQLFRIVFEREREGGGPMGAIAKSPISQLLPAAAKQVLRAFLNDSQMFI